MVLNFFVLRAFVSAIRLNGSFILRGLGLGGSLVKISLFCYYVVGLTSIIIFCRYLEAKVLGVWLGFYMGEIVMAGIFLYLYSQIDID